MVSTGKGEVGAAKLTGEVLDVVEKMPLLVQNMTGVDISKVPMYIVFVFNLKRTPIELKHFSLFTPF